MLSWYHLLHLVHIFHALRLNYLGNSWHDKSKPLIKQELCIEKYFLDPNFSKSDVELLFAFRTSMVRDIKNNFPQMYKNNIACDICKVHVCSHQHLLQCTELRKHVNVPDDIEYGDLFKNTEKQLKIVKIMKKLLWAREIIKCKWTNIGWADFSWIKYSSKWWALMPLSSLTVVRYEFLSGYQTSAVKFVW